MDTRVTMDTFAQIQQGVSFQHILDDIRDHISGDLKRIHLMTRKDVTGKHPAILLSQYIVPNGIETMLHLCIVG